MSIREQEHPEFAQALRGYDRTQVDGYLLRLREYAIEIEDRAVAAEEALADAREETAEARRELAAAGGGELPDRLAHILDLAHEEAGEIRARAQNEADIVERTAREELDRARSEARADAERIIAEGVETRVAIDEQVADLEARHRHLLEQLTALCADLTDTTQRHSTGTSSTEPTEALEIPRAEAV
jgi:DivIVA domain-containing protein